MSNATLNVKNVTGTVTDLKRAGHSVNGNPRWTVTLSVTAIDGEPTGATITVTAKTAPDASINYAIDNSEYRDTPHTYHMSKHGNIRTAEATR